MKFTLIVCFLLAAAAAVSAFPFPNSVENALKDGLNAPLIGILAPKRAGQQESSSSLTPSIPLLNSNGKEFHVPTEIPGLTVGTEKKFALNDRLVTKPSLLLMKEGKDIIGRNSTTAEKPRTVAGIPEHRPVRRDVISSSSTTPSSSSTTTEEVETTSSQARISSTSIKPALATNQTDGTTASPLATIANPGSTNNVHQIGHASTPSHLSSISHANTASVVTEKTTSSGTPVSESTSTASKKETIQGPFLSKIVLL